MLQQTQVNTVLPYFERFMQRFPSVERLAAASEADVLSAWQGLGYYSRARSLRRAAQVVVERHAGKLPRSQELLLELPGVGPYSAGAIASIAHGEPVPVVDGNVIRVLCRLFGLRGDPGRAPLKRELWRVAGELVPKERPGDFNQALMELGATVCSPNEPRCGDCPLQRECVAKQAGLTRQLPELAARVKATDVAMVAAVVRRGQRYLVTQLAEDAPRWASMWQFPNTELTTNQTPTEALSGLFDRASVNAKAPRKFLTLRHSVTRYRITLTAYLCEAQPAARGKLPPRFAWKTLAELEQLALPAAHRRIANALLSSPEATPEASA